MNARSEGLAAPREVTKPLCQPDEVGPSATSSWYRKLMSMSTYGAFHTRRLASAVYSAWSIGEMPSHWSGGFVW